MRNRAGASVAGEGHASRVVALACAASAGAHAGLVPAHLQSEPQLGAAFLLAVGLLLGAALALVLRPDDRRIATGAALLLAGLIIAYLASRTSGIPVLDPVREVLDAVGVATSATELVGLVFAFALMQSLGRHARPTYPQEVSR